MLGDFYVYIQLKEEMQTRNTQSTVTIAIGKGE